MDTRPDDDGLPPLPPLPTLAERLRSAFPDWKPPRLRAKRLTLSAPAGREPEPRAAPAARKLSRFLRLPTRPPASGGGLAGWGAWLGGLSLAVAGAGFAPAGNASAGEPFPDVIVANRQFQVTVAPRNEATKHARAADLYVAARPGSPWVRVGECAPIFRNGELFFERGLTAPEDGIYYFTSSAERQRDGSPLAPSAEEKPQARVVVDTLAPLAEWLEPARHFRIQPGDRLTLRWRSKDENLAPRPVTIAVSLKDNGIWNELFANQSANGQRTLIVPEDWPVGTVIFRIESVDLAGNRGVDWVEGTRHDVAPPAVPSVASTAVAVRAAPAAPRPAAQPPEPPPATVAAIPPARPAALDPQPWEKESPLVVDGDEIPEAASAGIPPRRRSAWVAYITACNQVRQDHPKDALRYFREAVDADPGFIEAWADFALTYKELGAFGPARDTLAEALRRDPENPSLLRLRGEIEHADGMARLNDARDRARRAVAREKIDLAIRYYAQALDAAKKSWQLSEQAPTYFRLGEICYYVNRDRDGARAYWRKILDLHATAPDREPLLHTRSEQEHRYETARYERHSLLRSQLDDWQTWSRQLLLELDRDERNGLVAVAPVSSDPERGRVSVFAETGAGAAAKSSVDLPPLPRDIPDARSSGTLASRGLSGSGSPLAVPGLAYGTDEVELFAAREGRPASPRRENGLVKVPGGVVDPRFAVAPSAASVRRDREAERDSGVAYLGADAPRQAYPPAAIPSNLPGRSATPETARDYRATQTAATAATTAQREHADWPGFTSREKVPAWTASNYGSRP